MPIFATSSILPELDDVRAHLNLTSTANDAELQGFLDAACDLVARYVGNLETTTYAETHFGVVGSRPIVLRRIPVVSIVSLSNVNGLTYAPTDYVLDAEAGLLRLAYAGAYSAWSGDLTITYTVGRDVLEPPVRLAILELVRDMWSGTQSGGAGAARYGQDVQEPVSSSGRPPLPPYVEGLIEPYRVAPKVA